MGVVVKENFSKWLPVAGCLALLWLLFPELPEKLAGMWEGDDFNYGYFVIPVALFIIREKRDRLNATPASASWGFLLPLGIGIGLYLLGELGGEFTLLFLSAWCLAMALCWLCLGWRKLRVIAFPLLFLLTMFPPPAVVYNQLTLKLKLISTQLGVALLQILGMSAYREGNVIDLGFTQLQVVDACSGLRYVFPLFVLGILLAHHLRAPLWRRVLLVAATVPLAIVTNSMRIALIGLLYPSMGRRTTEGLFHDFTGWLIFVLSLGVLLLIMRLLRKPVSAGTDSGVPLEVQTEASTEIPGAAAGWRQLRFLVMFLALGGLLFFIQGVEFREDIPIKQSLSAFPLKINQWQGVSVPMEQKFVDALHFTDYALIDYRNSAGRTINFYLAYYQSQSKGESIHSPSSCLPGGGWTFNESGVVKVGLSRGEEPALQVNRAFIAKGDARQLTYYWFPQRGRQLTGMLEMKFFTFWDALIRQRTDGALIRLVTPVDKNESVEQADLRLQEMTRQLLPLLDRFIPGKDA